MLGIEWRPSPNAAGVRGRRSVHGIVLHSTEGGLAGSLQILARAGGPSAHYVIGEYGQVYQLVDEREVAFHVAAFGGTPSLNRNAPAWLPAAYNGLYSRVNEVTIGIELAGFAAKGFTEQQYAVLGALIASIGARWSLAPTLLPDAGPSATVVTHGWLQTDRSDPGPHFSWDTLRAALASAPLPQPLPEAFEEDDEMAKLSAEDRRILDTIHGLNANADSIVGWVNLIGALEAQLAQLQQPAPVLEKVSRVTLTYEDGSTQEIAVTA